MVSVPQAPSDSSNRVLQDRFNRDAVAYMKQQEETIDAQQIILDDLVARVEALETP